jgi:multiple sugar transport system ATP-binding protein
LPLKDAAIWRHFQGRDVILGIRAEGIQIAGHGEVQGTLAKVRLVEHAGAEQVFFADAENIEFCGRVPADSDLRTGDDVHLHLVAHEMFLFDASTGVALVQGGQPARNAE